MSSLSSAQDSCTASDEAAVLELRGVYAGYGAATVIRDISISVRAGSVVALLGANGAGKTTLLRTASGLLTPSVGNVLLGGNDVTTDRPNKRARLGLCLIPEGRGIFRSLSVRDNLRIQQPKWVRDDHTDEAIEAFPVLGSRLNQLAGSMSGGEQQMLALSRTFMAEPKVVLLDEVSMGLAPLVLDQIFAFLKTLASRGVSLLLVEQYVDRALEMADAVVLLDRGLTTFSGSPDDLDHDELLRNYLGVANVDTGPPQSI